METCLLIKRPGLKKNFDFDQSLEREQKAVRGGDSAAIFRKLRSACVEVGSTHKHLRRGVNSNNFKNYFSSNDITCEEVKSVESTFSSIIGYIVRASNKGARKKGRIFPYFSKMYKNTLKEDLIRVVEDLDGTVESTDTIVKLKTKIENSSTFESDPYFIKTLIKNCIDERVSRNEREVTLEKQKIELAKLQLAKLEKEVELQTAKIKQNGLCCSEKSSSLGSGNEGKREIVLNRRPELERKISMRSTKDQLVKKDVLMPVKQCFPVEPSGCRRGAFT
ncbi:hypothetical protein TNCV_2167251 [Trichonephila clavipes]|nr:hypothetical protein TNCV_2167251 [Trichonephila clavipes]